MSFSFLVEVSAPQHVFLVRLFDLLRRGVVTERPLSTRQSRTRSPAPLSTGAAGQNAFPFLVFVLSGSPPVRLFFSDPTDRDYSSGAGMHYRPIFPPSTLPTFNTLLRTGN